MKPPSSPSPASSRDYLLTPVALPCTARVVSSNFRRGNQYIDGSLNNVNTESSVSLDTYSNLCDRGSQHLRVIQTCEGKTEADKRYLGEVRLQSAFSSLQRFLARSSVAFPRPLSLLIGRHPYRSCSHSALWNFRILQLPFFDHTALSSRRVTETPSRKVGHSLFLIALLYLLHSFRADCSIHVLAAAPHMILSGWSPSRSWSFLFVLLQAVHF